MHIVFIAPFGLQPKGTARVRALPLGAALVARGHRVTLLVPPWDDRAASGKTFDHHGVTVEQLSLPPSSLFDIPLLTIKLWQRIHALQPDIVHGFKPKAYTGFIQMGWWYRQTFAKSHVPFVIDTDDWEGKGGWNDAAAYTAPVKALFAWQEQWGLRHHDGVTVASRTLESIVRSMGVPPERIAFIPNGPGAAWELPSHEELAICRLRLHLDKSPVALLFTRFFEFDVGQMARRWAAVVRELPDARLLVIGKGLTGEEIEFRRAIEAVGVTDTVRDVGWQSIEQLPLYLALADVALYPMQDTLLNRAKCPVKLADYLQLGLPVVGEAVGMVQEYLGEGVGVLVPPDDDATFVAATVQLLSDQKQAAALGAAAYRRLGERFKWSVAAERLEQFYETVVRGRQSVENGQG